MEDDVWSVLTLVHSSLEDEQDQVDVWCYSRVIT